MIDTLELALNTTLNKVGKTPPTGLSIKEVDSLLYYCLSNPFLGRTEFVLRDLESSVHLRKISSDSLKNSCMVIR
ncbi:hypothetical protein [uncultured Winogradskyella sp.]|uniref:hypothetical protein n=1 Tax=uncultured Winogradskyella sp. TaxID=395353 RepID=UPI0030DA01F4